MIFIWGLLEDPTTKSVYDWLHRLGAVVVFVNHAAIRRTSVRFSSEPRASFQLVQADRSYELAEMSAAYLRPYDFRDYADYIGPEQQSQRVSGPALVHHLVNAWAEATPARVINRPSAEATNHSKLYQAIIIARSGFLTPASL